MPFVQTITRPFNGRPTSFDRTSLETAWLVLQEFTSEGMARNRAAVSSLVHNFGWDKSKAIEYVVVAANWNGKD